MMHVVCDGMDAVGLVTVNFGNLSAETLTNSITLW